MTISPEHNLDYLAAKHAQDLIKAAPDAENTVTKALGVLQENGVYACFLYLQAYKKKDEPDHIIRAMLDLLDEDQLGLPKRGNDDVLKYIADEITADLHRLLLAKEALEQMLIYARYGAKAAGKQSDKP
jgi:hypothetical protein